MVMILTTINYLFDFMNLSTLTTFRNVWHDVVVFNVNGMREVATRRTCEKQVPMWN